jgi:hypothetical protein
MRFKSEWVLKAMVESALVVGSILLALAMDEWSEDREYAKLADQSLSIFEQEIVANQRRLEDAAPFHQGILQVVGQMRFAPPAEVDLQSVMEGLQPPVMLNTAWETALATGALTHMPVDVVSALSLTYSIQERFTTQSRTERPRFGWGGAVSGVEVSARAQETFHYLSNLTRDEAELRTVYEQALTMIRAQRPVPAEETDPRDETHP